MFSASSGLCPETVLSEALPPRPREPSPGASGCSEPREVTVLPSPPTAAAGHLAFVLSSASLWSIDRLQGEMTLIFFL